MIDSEEEALSRSLVDELVGSVALPKNKLTRQIAWRLFRGATDGLARLGVPFDRLTAEEGLPQASTRCLSHFCSEILVRGQENVPKDGPLLVVSNHPGAYDGLVIFSQLPRKDIVWISTEIPFLRLLKNTSEHILFASRKDAYNRVKVAGNSIKHLRSGGALVYFAAGHRDPDPQVFPGAGESIESWPNVFDNFVERVPGLRILFSIVSGVVSEKWSRHSITWLRRKQIDKSRLAEFGQVITQLMKPGKLMLTPAISFSKPVEYEELKRLSAISELQNFLIQSGKNLLNDHLASVIGSK